MTNTTEKPSLPGVPPPVLQAVWEALSPAEGQALVSSVLDKTSAEYIEYVLAQFGHRVSATTVRTYRRALRRAGVLV